jgi:AraC-like DNA-binding protein
VGEEWTYGGAGLYFVLAKAGAGRNVAGKAARHFASGDVLVLNGESGGRLCVSGKGDMVFWYFSLRLEHLFPLFAGHEICLLKNVTNTFDGTKLYPASGALAKECCRLLEDVPAESDLCHRSQLLRVAAAILAEEFKMAHHQQGGFVRVEDHIHKVLERLSGNGFINLRVGELASEFGCSRRHLNRLFHQHFGVSVARLRMEMRLLKSVALLRDPDAKVINVAEACGFNHLGLFNTCFKRRFGASPGRWQKMAVRAETQPGSLVEEKAMMARLTSPLRISDVRPDSSQPDAGPPAQPNDSPTQEAAPTRVSMTIQRMIESFGKQLIADQQEVREGLPKANASRVRP